MPKDVAGGHFSDGSLSAAVTKQLQDFATRAGQIMDERDALNEDLKEIMNDAKDSGIDTKILRKAIKRVRTPPKTAKSEEAMIASYVAAIQELPLFQHANEEAAAGASGKPN